MKKIFLCFSILIFTKCFSQLNVVPMPAEVKMGIGNAIIKQPVGFIIYSFDNVNDNDGVDAFKKYLTTKYNITKFKDGDSHSYGLPFEVHYGTLDTKKDDGYYELEVKENKVFIKGSALGKFYAFETLKQLITTNKIGQLIIPHVTIKDYPRFAYRGMHLDVCRHFFDVQYVKKYIDYLATYKFNTFHWHLTEDQGWRIEIKKYPNLTKVGAYRDRTLIGRYGSNIYDSIKYGGYYTQKEIKEVVKYATERHITIIPEIEMPGHSTAALASYHFLGCTKGPYKTMDTWGVLDDVYCAGNDSTFTFLQNVLDEVLQLFPSKYIHIGGDECPKERWKKCAACQKRMKDNNLKDEHALQSYFIQRIEKYLNSKGRKIIGWDEILEGGLAPNATVMSWRGEEGGIEAAKQNHDVVMTPGSHCYFDHSQTKNEDSLTIGNYLPLEKVYMYEPVPAVLNKEQQKHILGAQGNVWTEYIANTSKLEYMIFPRMQALSEVLWSPKNKRNWKDFERRLPSIFERLDKKKINYSGAYLEPQELFKESTNNEGVIWNLKSKTENAEIIIIKPNKIAGELNILSKNKKEVNGLITESGIYTYNLFSNKTLFNRRSQEFHFNKATGKKIKLTYEPNKSYPGDGAFTLVNGIQNEKGLARSTEFVGFLGTDLEAVIDLGSEMDIKEVRLHTFQKKNSWIYHPKNDGINAQISNDGINFTTPEDETLSLEPNTLGVSSIRLNLSNTFIKTRYVKVVAKNYGTIPTGQPGEDTPAWLFVDEIEVL